ncbi:MAG: flagellar motor switch protein FliM [Deltaproteobacteria bacterium]|nr:flagellar motor switch protein FliM [Deltaproteobacteria bacterium]
MANILSQEEVDALLRGISGGEIETDLSDLRDPSDVMTYDLTSQDRIIRGRMPTLEMTNEKFVRLFRTTLSSLLRKVTSVSAISTDMVKFGEFLKMIPVPTSMHLFKMEPLRGSALIIVESKIIFMLVDIIFGGSGRNTYKIEGREFTAIENNIIKKVVLSALGDIEKAWQSLINVKTSYLRSEINPQFVQLVPPTDVVIVSSFEIEVEYSSGTISLCIPYSTLEPLRDRLQAGYQSEQLEVDKTWINRFKSGLFASQVNLNACLGNAQVNTGDVINLKKGDVIPLDQYVSDPIDIFVEGVLKFRGRPVIYKGNQAIQVSHIISNDEVNDYGTE